MIKLNVYNYQIKLLLIIKKLYIYIHIYICVYIRVISSKQLNLILREISLKMLFLEEFYRFAVPFIDPEIEFWKVHFEKTEKIRIAHKNICFPHIPAVRRFFLSLVFTIMLLSAKCMRKSTILISRVNKECPQSQVHWPGLSLAY